MISSLLLAQSENIHEDSLSIVVESIIVSGNEKTQEFIILRELTFSAGDTISTEEIRFSIERIKSLGLFYSVEFNLSDSETGKLLEIIVKESWYIFPVPFVRFQNNDLSKSNYGISLVWKNFTGRNDDVVGFLSLGHDPSWGITYSNPVLDKDLDLIFSSGFSNQSFENRSQTAISITGEQFSYNMYSGMVGFGKRFNLYNQVFFSTGFLYAESPHGYDRVTASGTTIDRNPFITALYTFDSRDLRQFPKNGIFGQVNYTWQGWGLDNYNYNILGLDYRHYNEIGWDVTTRWRLASRNTFGTNIPLYHSSFLGFNEYVRGNKNKEREGNNSFIASLEFSYPIIKAWPISMKFPLLPQSLTSTLISVHLNVYTDTGLTYNNGEKIAFNNFDSGYGFGLTVLFLPYNSVRFEYAFNEFGKGEFLFGTGFSF